MLAVAHFFDEDVAHIVLACNMGDVDGFALNPFTRQNFPQFNASHDHVCHGVGPEDICAVVVEDISGTRNIVGH